MCDEINNTCTRLGIKCIRIPYSIHIGRDNSHEACADVVQYSLDTFGFDYPGIVAILDSDMFLIKKFSIKKYLEGYDLAGCPQSRGNGKVEYIWNGIVFMDMRTLPNKRTMNWDCGKVDGESVDVGGQLHHYLKNNPDLRVKLFGALHSDSFPKDTKSLKELNFNDTIIEYLIMKKTHNIEFFIDNHFLHYRGGTNWDQKSPGYHQEKSKILNDFINKIIDENTLS